MKSHADSFSSTSFIRICPNSDITLHLLMSHSCLLLSDLLYVTALGPHVLACKADEYAAVT